MEKNIHHLYPTSRGWSNRKINKRKLDKIEHENIHRLFSNNTPIEQILSVLEINEKIFTNYFIQKIMDVIIDVWNDCYKKWTLK